MSINVETLKQRLLAKCEQVPGGCWLWTGARNAQGYGMVNIAQGDGRFRPVGAHRLSILAFTGVDPGDQSVLHSCDTPPCINPGHLRVGTQVENMQDMATRTGRKRQCKGKAKDGERCRRITRSGSDYCGLHDPSRHSMKLWQAMEDTARKNRAHDAMLKLLKRIAAGRSKDPQHDAEMLLTEIA